MLGCIETKKLLYHWLFFETVAIFKRFRDKNHKDMIRWAF